MKFIRFLAIIALILFIINNVEGFLLLKQMQSLPKVFSKIDLLIVIVSLLFVNVSGFIIFLNMKRLKDMKNKKKKCIYTP